MGPCGVGPYGVEQRPWGLGPRYSGAVATWLVAAAFCAVKRSAHDLSRLVRVLRTTSVRLLVSIHDFPHSHAGPIFGVSAFPRTLDRINVDCRRYASLNKQHPGRERISRRVGSL